MNPARTEVSARGQSDGAGVHASLDQLVRLRFKARGFSFLPRQPIHSVLAGRHASRLRGRGLNFEELRAYLPGDDIRTLDWKVTARTREPHVRVYTEERDRAVWLLVDQRMSMFFGSRQRMKSVLAAEAAALAAWRVLAVGDRVGGVVFGDEGQDIVTPHRSEQRVMEFLGRIVRHNGALDARNGPAPNPGGLNEALATAERHALHDCLIALVTDGEGADEETRGRIARLAQHNDVLVVFTYDPLEREFDDHGRLAFSDGVAQVEANTASRSFRDGYQASFDERMTRMRQVSRRYEVPWLPIHTDEGVPEQIRDLLGRPRTAPRR